MNLCALCGRETRDGFRHPSTFYFLCRRCAFESHLHVTGQKVANKKMLCDDLQMQILNLETKLQSLSKLEWSLKRKAERVRGDINGIADTDECYLMPEPPAPMAVVLPEQPIFPKSSGIYFVWSSAIVYVGRSLNLASRVQLGHHAISEGDQASWLPFEVRELDFAECYYIWRCRPCRNFGRHSKANTLQM